MSIFRSEIMGNFRLQKDLEKIPSGRGLEHKDPVSLKSTSLYKKTRRSGYPVINLHFIVDNCWDVKGKDAPCIRHVSNIDIKNHTMVLTYT